MASLLLDRLSRGSFSFLRPDTEELRRVVPDHALALPAPQRIFLEKESATPLVGYPVLRSPGSHELRSALESYLLFEEEAQCAYFTRSSFDSRAYGAAWKRCQRAVAQPIENTSVLGFGQNFPAVFWLDLSLFLARHLKDVPKRVLRRDLSLGREHGDVIKYRVLFKLLDRVVSLTYDIVQRLAEEAEKGEQDLYPPILDRMRDNVLILSEDHVSPDLSELSSYFRGHLQIGGRDFRARLTATLEWYRETVARDPFLAAAIPNLVAGEERDPMARSPLTRSGLARFISRHPEYDAERLLRPRDVEVWEGLLARLKEFEVLHAIRRMVVPLEREEGELVSRDRSANTTWVGGPPVLQVSSTTRPYDFTMPLVVDPLVHRFGLVYDISHFSATLMVLGRSEASALERAFRMMVLFQQRVNRLAASKRLTLEKYLGDGAFFSGRLPRNMLSVAVELQRIYQQTTDEGFPFDRGLRIALNYGQYRMLPLAADAEGTGAARYEFFGLGLVELSRLATGKATRDLEEVKTYMVTQGYPHATVNKFFAPLLRRSTELVDHGEQQRRFFAYINANRILVNEGIVATEDFVHHLGTFDRMQLAQEGGRRYIVVRLPAEAAGVVRVGIRKLGTSQFKGIGELPVYEVADAESWQAAQYQDLPGQDLMSGLQRLFAADVSRRQRQPAESSKG